MQANTLNPGLANTLYPRPQFNSKFSPNAPQQSPLSFNALQHPLQADPSKGKLVSFPSLLVHFGFDRVRTRIAPSPTGELHLGTLRTALINYLYAKHNHGDFILRIEDTDANRSKQSYAVNILKGLNSVGLHWDEGPTVENPNAVSPKYGSYYQSQRTGLYADYAQKLLDSGKAYFRYMTDEEFNDLQKKVYKSTKEKPYVYRGSNDVLTPDEIRRRAVDPLHYKPVIFFRIPDNQGPIVIHDMVKGKVVFDPSTISDFVLIRPNGLPSYNYACVIDDHEMEISHVIRGEDHLSNTAKQIMLYNAFGFEVPDFGHLGMVLGQDGKKLSKRHGATSVEAFTKIGYLPEAILEQVAREGATPYFHNHETRRQLTAVNREKQVVPYGAAQSGVQLTSESVLGTFADEFEMNRVSKNGLQFDQKQLAAVNRYYLQHMDLPRVVERMVHYFNDPEYLGDKDAKTQDVKLRFPILSVDMLTQDQLSHLVDIYRFRVQNNMLEIRPEVDIYFQFEPQYNDPRSLKELNEKLQAIPLSKGLNFAKGELNSIQMFFESLPQGQSQGQLSESLNAQLQKLDSNQRKAMIHLIRYGLTGKYSGPNISDIAYILGPERTANRLAEFTRQMPELLDSSLFKRMNAFA